MGQQNLQAKKVYLCNTVAQTTCCILFVPPSQAPPPPPPQFFQQIKDLLREESLQPLYFSH